MTRRKTDKVPERFALQTFTIGDQTFPIEIAFMAFPWGRPVIRRRRVKFDPWVKPAKL